MSSKRMRVFAGPNGSGKTTIFKGLLEDEKIQLGVYVNADEIEQTLSKTNTLFFGNYGLEVSQEEVSLFFMESDFSPIKRGEPDLWTELRVEQNILHCNTHIDSYLAADIADFIRQKLLAKGLSFTYETVMSHAKKIDFLKEAQKQGFRVYLYFVATEDPAINISRVKVRVAQNGHQVSPEIITSRYYRSLENLKLAVKNTNRAYIFDNSEKQAKLIAEITDGEDVVTNDAVNIPAWVMNNLLNKQP